MIFPCSGISWPTLRVIFSPLKPLEGRVQDPACDSQLKLKEMEGREQETHGIQKLPDSGTHEPATERRGIIAAFGYSSEKAQPRVREAVQPRGK